MEVILLDDVLGLGEAGKVVKVKDGYARNYLLPRGLAQKVSAEALNRIHLIEQAAEQRRRKRILEVKDKIAVMTGKQVVVPMKAGAEAKLFGAVTTMLLSERITEQYELEIDRRFIELAEPIKYLGSYEVKLRAGSEVPASIHVVVVDESIYFSEGPEAAVAAVTAGAAAPVVESALDSAQAERTAVSEAAAVAEEAPGAQGTLAEESAEPSTDAGSSAETAEDAGDEPQPETKAGKEEEA